MKTLAPKQFYFVIALAFIALVSNAAIPIYALNILQSSTKEILVTKDNIEILDNVLLNMVDAETGMRGYVITGNSKFLEPFFSGQQKIASLLPKLKRSIASDSLPKTFISQYEQKIISSLARIRYNVALRETSGFEKSLDSIMTGEGKKRMDAVREASAELREIEVGRLEQLESRQTHIARYTNGTLFVVTILDLLLFSAAFIFLLRSLKKSNAVQQHLNLLHIETLKKSDLLVEKNNAKNIQARLNEVLQTVHSLDEAYAAIGNYCGHLFSRYPGAFYIKSNSKDYFEQKASWGTIKQVDGFEPSACWAARRNNIYRFDHLARELPCQHNAEINFRQLSIVYRFHQPMK
ncbi:MAG: CHASE3 domain-containing protein [Methylotenera sp.]|nr:CHASE3 domain-containing protein [Methylotenera sp.]